MAKMARKYTNLMISPQMRRWLSSNAEKHKLAESTLVELCLQWYISTGSNIGREVVKSQPPYDDHISLMLSADIREWVEAEAIGMGVSIGEVIRIALDVARWECPYLVKLEPTD